MSRLLSPYESIRVDEAVGETRPINVSANDLIVIVQPKCLRER